MYPRELGPPKHPPTRLAWYCAWYCALGVLAADHLHVRTRLPPGGLLACVDGICDVNTVLQCRSGMQADFTVLDGNMLEALEGGNHIPAVKATFVNGICRHGCNLYFQSCH